ncbi:MAG: hypothetical protein IAG13_00670 [Deltaproteobacteria bacterium]|nr:hypothetical protein [Nannocystaceae bacterium]
MRSTFAASMLFLSGCWNGADALHLPCTDDDHCGRGQSCVDGFCDGPPEGSSGTAVQTDSGSASDSGAACLPAVPSTCASQVAASPRALSATTLVNVSFGRGLAVVSGQFAGNERIDLAVLNGGGYSLAVMENAPNTWIEADLFYVDTSLTELRDMLAIDLDGDQQTEFVVLSAIAGAEVFDWSDEAGTSLGLVDLPTSDLLSLAGADVNGDGNPELIVSGSSQVHIVPNDGGDLDGEATRSVSGSFAQPWDTFVVGEGPEIRILVPEADNTATMGVENQLVNMLRVAELAPVATAELGSDFQNPWAIAEGDFLGDEALEIVVAERRLNLPDIQNGTTEPGRLRFFSLVGDAVSDVGEPLEIGVGPMALAAADLDCDGKDDLVIGTSGSPGMYDGSPQVLFGSCDASASAENLLTLGQVEGSGVNAWTRMAVGDFDDDGLPEVAIADVGNLDDASVPGERVVFVGVQEAM